MSVPDIKMLAVYLDAQMAAEAFLMDETTHELATVPGIVVPILTAGNGRASKFSPTQAQQFLQHWRVIDQQENTSTGSAARYFSTPSATNMSCPSARPNSSMTPL